MARKWISFPRIEGQASRQAHADLPEGTYEREMGKEGFFGPATHFYHAHPPTGWVDWDGPLRPRAFETAKFPAGQDGPWSAQTLLSNANVRMRIWKSDGAMDHLVRNADGDEDAERDGRDAPAPGAEAAPPPLQAAAGGEEAGAGPPAGGGLEARTAAAHAVPAVAPA